MMYKYNLKLFSLILFTLLFINLPSKILAQSKSEPMNFASPNIANLGAYGDLGVNYYTGSPSIAINLHEIGESNIKIPISLSYSSSMVKPNIHPGWTGLGWNLNNCNGYITRILRENMDERRLPEGFMNRNVGFYSNYEKLNIGTWFSDENLKKFAHDQMMGNPVYEVIADEFVFNFLGYSGKFIFGHDGKWHVLSETDIKVEFNEDEGFIASGNIRSSIASKVPPELINATDRYFNKFTLITPDGSRYTFGGVNATEYSTNYRRQSQSLIIPTTWFLTEISTISARKIDFYYHEGPAISSLTTYYYYSRMNRPADDGLFSIFSLNLGCRSEDGRIGRLPANGFLLFPVYLDSIKTSNETVVFEHSITKELRYNDYDLDYHILYDKLDENEQTDDRRIFYNYIRSSSDIQWKQLDRIKIKYSNNQLLKEFDLNYSNSDTTRLKLLSIQEKDRNGIAKPAYTFSYKPSTFKPYCSDRMDHWGFNNSFEPANFLWNKTEDFIEQYPSVREPDTTGIFCQSELLDTLFYPTSGFNVFEFEPHTYSKVVNPDRISLTFLTKSKVAGGVRIKKVKSFVDKYSLPIVKEYLYLDNYTGQQNYSGLLSSGVLAGENKYYWHGFKGKDLGGENFTYDLFNSGSVFPNSVNVEGNHVGYTNVIELSNGNGYSKYTYTNFDTKESIIYPHMDEKAINWTNPDRSIYSPYTSKALERGKIACHEIHNRFNQKVKEVRYTYTRSSNSFLRGLQLDYLNLCSETNASAQVFFGTAYKIYEYSFLLSSEIEKTYSTDDYGNEDKAISAVINYEYNSRKLVKKVTINQSDGTQFITFNKYPFDYNIPGDTVLSEMATDKLNLGSAIIEQQVWKKNRDNPPVIIKGTINQYGKNYLPIKTYRLESTTPSNFYQTLDYSGRYTELIPGGMPYVKQSELKYDSYGNLIEFRQPGQPTESYIYSYNHLFPVAKIHNANTQEIFTALGYTKYQDFENAIGGNYNDIAKNQVNSLRVLISKARISTFTHDALLGITSISDENGRNTFYAYDNFSRLLFIRDNDLNIIRSYRYNYKAN